MLTAFKNLDEKTERIQQQTDAWRDKVSHQVTSLKDNLTFVDCFFQEFFSNEAGHIDDLLYEIERIFFKFKKNLSDHPLKLSPILWVVAFNSWMGMKNENNNLRFLKFIQLKNFNLFSEERLSFLPLSAIAAYVLAEKQIRFTEIQTNKDASQMVHEIIHHVLETIYSNQGLPFFKENTEKAQEWWQLVNSVDTCLQAYRDQAENTTKRENSFYPVGHTLDFKKYYPEAQWSSELAARLIEDLVVSNDQAIFIKDDDTLAKIKQFYVQITEDCCKYLETYLQVTGLSLIFGKELEFLQNSFYLPLSKENFCSLRFIAKELNMFPADFCKEAENGFLNIQEESTKVKCKEIFEQLFSKIPNNHSSSVDYSKKNKGLYI